MEAEGQRGFSVSARAGQAEHLGTRTVLSLCRSHSLGYDA